MYRTIEDMIIKTQSLGGKKLKFLQKISDYYDQKKFMEKSKTFHFEEDPSSKGAQGIALIIDEAVLVMIFLQTKQAKKKNIIYYDLNLNIIKNVSEEG